MTKEEITEKITPDAVISVLSEHGIEPYRIKENEVWYNTFCHCGNSHKLCFYRDTKTFYCYTNCGAMSLFTAVMKLRDCSYKEAFSYLSRKCGGRDRKGFDHPAVRHRGNSFLEKRRSLKEKKNVNTELPVLNERILSYFDTDVYYEGWLDEGITPEAMRTFDIRFYELQNQIVIPHKNTEGKLVGIRRRSLNPDEIAAGNKYMPLTLESVTYAHPLGLNLYGLYENKKAIIRNKRVIIFEGEKSVLKSRGFYGDNDCSVAVCGFNVSPWQTKTLRSLGVREVVLGFDKDFNEADFENPDNSDPAYQEYKRYLRKILTSAHKFTPYCNTYVLWDRENLLDLKDSPIDKGKEVFERLYKNKIAVTTDDVLNIN